MLYNIIKKKRGKKEVVFTDTLAKCNNRLKQLRASKVKESVFELVQAEEEAEKFAKPPHDGSYREGKGGYPQRIK